MKAVAWKERKVKDKIMYVLQVDGIKGVRSENKVTKDLSDWDQYAEGYDASNKAKTIIFKNYFNDEDEWKSWARQFPYQLTEIGQSGKEKPYKLGLDYINSPRRRRKDA